MSLHIVASKLEKTKRFRYNNAFKGKNSIPLTRIPCIEGIRNYEHHDGIPSQHQKLKTFLELQGYYWD